MEEHFATRLDCNVLSNHVALRCTIVALHREKSIELSCHHGRGSEEFALFCTGEAEAAEPQGQLKFLRAKHIAAKGLIPMFRSLPSWMRRAKLGDNSGAHKWGYSGGA